MSQLAERLGLARDYYAQTGASSYKARHLRKGDATQEDWAGLDEVPPAAPGCRQRTINLTPPAPSATGFLGRGALHPGEGRLARHHQRQAEGRQVPATAQVQAVPSAACDVSSIFISSRPAASRGWTCGMEARVISAFPRARGRDASPVIEAD